jgi:large subunit ribosomal protein L21
MLGGDKTVVGAPLVAGAAVQADVIDQIKSEKTIKFVKRRRKHSSKRTRGHRQHLTLVRVTEILASGAEKSKVQEAVGAGSLDFQFAENVKVKTPAGSKTMAEKSVKETVKKEVKTTKIAKPAAVAKEKKSAPVKEKKTATSVSDDLKQLSGVGPALEKKLHAAGVKSFEQIAAWSSKDIEVINEKISSKGRVEKEGWIDQAKEKLKG